MLNDNAPPIFTQTEVSCSKKWFEHIVRTAEVRLRLSVTVYFKFYAEMAESVRFDDICRNESDSFRRYMEFTHRYLKDERFLWTSAKYETDPSDLRWYDEFSLYLALHYDAHLSRAISEDFYNECDSRGELLVFLKGVVDGYSYETQSPDTAIMFWKMIEPYSTIPLECITYGFRIGPTF